MTVDWARYRKCPVDGAEIGEPCTSLSGLVYRAGAYEAVAVPCDAPHHSRQQRTTKEVSRA